MTQLFVAGVCTQKVGEVTQTLMGIAPSASAGSRLNQPLPHQFEPWRERRLQEHWRILYRDGIHFDIGHGDQTDSTILFTALGVDMEGSKDMLAWRICAEEDKDGWSCVLQDLRERGVTKIDLIVTDGHEGLLAAVAALFPATARQRCGGHTQRHVRNALPKRERGPIATELAGIWKAAAKVEALTPGSVSRQIAEMLSRSRAKSDGRERTSPHLVRLSSSHASLHWDHQCD